MYLKLVRLPSKNQHKFIWSLGAIQRVQPPVFLFLALNKPRIGKENLQEWDEFFPIPSIDSALSPVPPKEEIKLIFLIITKKQPFSQTSFNIILRAFSPPVPISQVQNPSRHHNLLSHHQGENSKSNYQQQQEIIIVYDLKNL